MRNERFDARSCQSWMIARASSQLRIPMTRVLFVALVAALCTAKQAAGQANAPLRPGSGPGEIRGHLVDSASRRAVATGSVAVRRAGDSAFVSGALPKEDGSFQVDGLRPGRYTLRVRAIGFAPVIRNDIAITTEHPVVDLGAIGLSVVA